MAIKRELFLSLLQHFFILSAQALSAHNPHFHRSLDTDKLVFLEFNKAVATGPNSLLESLDPHFHRSLETDKLALLELKKVVATGPNSSLQNWDETTHVCSFIGVKCKHRVTRLELPGAGLSGKFPHAVTNLTALRYLDLSDNRLFGNIPPEISSLRHLRTIMLDDNQLSGPIPDSFSLLTNLTLVSLSNNSLTGEIPASFFSNCTSLLNLDLSSNFLTGMLPEEIGNCPRLWTLNLYNNQFTGEIPVSLANASTMFNIDLEYNLFSGELPSKIVGKLTRLYYLHLSYNRMVSHDDSNNLDVFFTALSNCTVLEELELAGMGLGGVLPSSIGKLSPKLKNLYLQENTIIGSVPPVLANLSGLMNLNLTLNRLTGIIPEEISELEHLDQLFLSHNLFSGEIPAALGQSPHLGLLDLSHNRFSGKIPASLGNLTRMRFMFLNNNLLSGEIPPSLGQCGDLSSLDLSYNQLTGKIPHEISGIRQIAIFLNLSNNHLQGPLPLELSKFENVQEIDLSANNFTGTIFAQISSCIALEMLNLSKNLFQGQLPVSLGDLRNLKAFDASMNNLSGRIPVSLSKIDTLGFLNLSSNNFEGPIPDGGIFARATSLSFLNNPRLCGPVLGIPTCSPRKRFFHSTVFLIIFVLVISLSVFITTICCVVGWRHIEGILRSSSSETLPERESKSKSKEGQELVPNFPRMTYKELSDATGGFDEQRLLGSGGYGRVYKGVLRDGTQVAIKVLQLQTGNSTKSFTRECQVLKSIRHRNLIRIITTCSLPDFKAIVLPFMANGSLESRLYPPPGGKGLGSGSSDLSLVQRVNICSDIAEGMAYLHHHSPVRVIHCDLKPSNVLLNDDMTALVSDFGIARLVMTVGVGNSAGVVENMGTSTANMLCGSIGYIAPEYGFGSSTSTKGDVYSFGVLVLEMVTRKRPTDDMFVGGLSLQRWVKSHYHGRIEQVMDSSLVRAMRDQSPDVKKMSEVAIGELFELGILCTQETPSTRPTMLDAADDLDRLKRYLNGDMTTTFASSLGISSSTLGDDYSH